MKWDEVFFNSRLSPERRDSCLSFEWVIEQFLPKVIVQQQVMQSLALKIFLTFSVLLSHSRFISSTFSELQTYACIFKKVYLTENFYRQQCTIKMISRMFNSKLGGYDNICHHRLLTSFSMLQQSHMLLHHNF